MQRDQHVAFGIDLDRALGQRLLRRQDGRQRLVLDGDQSGRRRCLGRRVGGDRGDRLADIAHPVPGQHRRVGDQGADELLAGVRCGDGGADAGRLLRLRGVEAQDPGVGVLAAHEARMQHALHLDIGGIAGSPPHLVEGVVAGDGLAHRAGRGVHARQAPAHALDDAAILALPVGLLRERPERELLAFRLRPM